MSKEIKTNVNYIECAICEDTVQDYVDGNTGPICLQCDEEETNYVQKNLDRIYGEQ